ncbi:urea amidolyase associated protein UAAP1 [Ruminiclostridium cellobioparum]|uniref:Urea carboxylase-associated protein 2 n=1 Tax=Ruminiclostridium cellobioparum subsp. termitidis CT1112 TaxID=1195236 RepID=S0FLR2_RUMCE|nr:urea amidolyase associated protein UAAP1 [Ruminiclostridium cellobioparum]EMS69408.1 urea carboxylase-associated protein 2 [Ruminiclostridium cellobioparum subsp. termitidis CT1112]
MKQIWNKKLLPGEKWSGNIGRGKYIHFKALGPDANVSMLLYNMRDTSERYNMPDTLKAQYTAHLKRGNILMSDNGRVLASIVEDRLGWHDTLCGYTSRRLTDERYGSTNYQNCRNEWLKSGEENFLVELVRNGMGARDLVPCINVFSKVYCEDDGSMHYETGHCKEGSTFTLRTEMEIIIILSNTPNPLDKRKTYPSVPVMLEVYDAPAADLQDECVNFRPENYRAFQNTWDYYNLMGL